MKVTLAAAIAVVVALLPYISAANTSTDTVDADAIATSTPPSASTEISSSSIPASDDDNTADSDIASTLTTEDIPSEASNTTETPEPTSASSRRFSCLYEDGASDLYAETIGETRKTFKCLMGTKCYQRANKYAEIQCIYPESQAVTSTPPSDAVVFASGNYAHAKFTASPTSSEPRVLSVNIVLPTIAVHITDDESAQDAATVISIEAATRTSTQLKEVPILKESEDTSVDDTSSILSVDLHPVSSAVRLTSSSATGSHVVWSDEFPSVAAQERHKVTIDDGDIFSVLYMSNIRSQNAESTLLSTLPAAQQALAASVAPSSTAPVFTGSQPPAALFPLPSATAKMAHIPVSGLLSFVMSEQSVPTSSAQPLQLSLPPSGIIEASAPTPMPQLLPPVQQPVATSPVTPMEAPNLGVASTELYSLPVSPGAAQLVSAPVITLVLHPTFAAMPMTTQPLDMETLVVPRPPRPVPPPQPPTPVPPPPSVTLPPQPPTPVPPPPSVTLPPQPPTPVPPPPSVTLPPQPPTPVPPPPSASLPPQPPTPVPPPPSASLPPQPPSFGPLTWTSTNTKMDLVLANTQANSVLDPIYPQYTPIIPFITNGMRQPTPTQDDPEETKAGMVNADGIASVLQDVFHVPADKIMIDGKPVAANDLSKLGKGGNISVMVMDPTETNKSKSKALDDDDDLFDDIDDDSDSETVTHSLNVDRFKHRKRPIVHAHAHARLETARLQSDGDVDDEGYYSGDSDDSDSDIETDDDKSTSTPTPTTQSNAASEKPTSKSHKRHRHHT